MKPYVRKALLEAKRKAREIKRNAQSISENETTDTKAEAKKQTKTFTVQVALKKPADYKRPFFNFYCTLVFALQKKIVPSRIKNALLRTTGMHVGEDACIPHDITFDPYFPELITLRSGCLIGGESHIRAHKREGKTLTLGVCDLGEESLVGGLSTVGPGAIVQKHSMVNLYSTFTGIAFTGELWGKNPPQCMAVFDEKTYNKFFVKPSMDKETYYKEFHEKVAQFRRDPTQMYLKIYYAGKRRNAGNEWFRARPLWRIWYNGVLVELARRVPGNWLRILLYRCVGVHIGKHVHIGRGVVFDHIYGDMVRVGDYARIGHHSYFDGHEYTITQTVFGRTTVGKHARLAPHTYVRCGTLIGNHVRTQPYTMLAKTVPAREEWAGIPAKKVKDLKVRE